MRRSLLILALAGSALLGLARADDGEPALPFNPFAEAKEGDWETLSFQMERPGHPRYTSIETWSVAKVTSDAVTVRIETLVPGGPDKPRSESRSFPRRGPLTLRAYFNMVAGDTLGDVKTKDRRFTFEGHTFDGQQIDMTRQGGKVPGDCSLLVAAEIKGPAVVFLQRMLPGGGFQQHSVAGFGTAEKKLWGKTADEIPIIEEKGAEKAIAFNLYRDARYGFSIHAPRFREAQERESSEAFTYRSGLVSFAEVIQGDPTDRATVRGNAKEQLAKAGFELLKDEETTVSGKDASLMEYKSIFNSPDGPFEGRVVDLAIFRGPHRITIRTIAPEKRFNGGKFEKSLRAALSSVKLIDLGGGAEHQGDVAGVFIDYRYGVRLPLPELSKVKDGATQPIVEFQASREAHGNTSRVAVTLVNKALSRADYDPAGVPELEVVSKKELEVSGRPALMLETKGKIDGRPVQGLSLVVFGESRTFVVDAAGAKAAWDEEGDAFRDSLASFKLEP